MINHSNKQAGGTLLGLIIGLIIGLVIAVGVAMTIKNTPLPFNNKLGKQNRSQEPNSGQITDPNKPMYGNREAARQAAKDVPRKTEEEKSAEAEAQTQAQVQAEEEKKAEAKAKVAKLDSKPPVLDKSTPEKPDAAKILNGETTSEKFTYFLQAGAFLEQADAENAKAKLALMGVAANIAERKSDNGILYRVRVGPFGQLETMNRVRSRLTDNGVDVAVIRVPK